MSQNGHETLLACSEMKKEISPEPVRLSSRQKECLTLIAQGHKAASVAAKLGISTRMVSVHLRATREKLDAVSTSQAIHNALVLGLLDKKD